MHNQTELLRDQKNILLNILCELANAEERLSDIADEVELDSTLQSDLQTVAFACNTCKARLQEILVQ